MAYYLVEVTDDDAACVTTQEIRNALTNDPWRSFRTGEVRRVALAEVTVMTINDGE